MDTRIVKRIKIKQMRWLGQRKASLIRNPWVDNGSNCVHASNGRAKWIATCPHLGCTIGERIEAVNEVLCTQPRLTHGCSVKKVL